VRAALRPYGVTRDAELALAFVDDGAMRDLNRRYRGKDRTTDVLSFGQSLRPGAKGAAAATALKREADGTLELGDVVISGAQAARQAKGRKWPLATEVAFLAAHGALHLLGYEDDTSVGYKEMLRLGREALKGEGTVFGRLSHPKAAGRVRSAHGAAKG
jgi:probable rRNA maturation factor